MRNSKISRMTKIALFAALIGAMSYISIPIPPVPITGQTLAIMLAGLILAPVDAGLSVVIFIFLGAIGIPMFSNGQAGLGVLFGPTGGYIFAFLISAIFISYFKGDGKNLTKNIIVTAIGGVIIVYSIGVPWLSINLDINIISGLKAGTIPFLIGDIIKVLIASVSAIKINKALN